MISLWCESCEEDIPCSGGAICADTNIILLLPIESCLPNSIRVGKEYEDLLHLHLANRQSRLPAGVVIDPVIESIKPSSLLPTQRDVSASRIIYYAKGIIKPWLHNELPTIIRFDGSLKNYIVNGHHRICARAVTSGDIPIDCEVYKFKKEMII